MHDDELRRLLFGIAQHGDVDELVEKAGELVRMPLAVMDAACFVLAKHPAAEQAGCTHWNSYRPGEQVDSAFIHAAWKEGHVARLSESDAPVLVDWGFAAAEPRLTQELRWQGAPVGYLIALTDHGSYTAEQEEGLAVLAEMLTFMLAMHGQHNQAHTTFANALFLGLFTGNLGTREAVESLIETSRMRLAGRYVVVAVQGCEHDEAELRDRVPKLWETDDPSMFSHFADGTLYLLVGDLEGPFEESAQHAQVVRLVREAGLCCGVSCPFDSLLDLKSHRWEADKALELGCVHSPGEHVHRYADHVIEAVVQAAVREMPKQALMHPALALLEAYDARHGTELLETLRAYLFTGRDVKQTVEQLHVHKNTLWYRLDRIRDIAGIDLNDAGGNVLVYLSLVNRKMSSRKRMR